MIQIFLIKDTSQATMANKYPTPPLLSDLHWQTTDNSLQRDKDSIKLVKKGSHSGPKVLFTQTYKVLVKFCLFEKMMKRQITESL